MLVSQQGPRALNASFWRSKHVLPLFVPYTNLPPDGKVNAVSIPSASVLTAFMARA